MTLTVKWERNVSTDTFVLRSRGTITSKVIFLPIGTSENEVSDALCRNDRSAMWKAHFQGECSQETSLHRVVERQPGQQPVSQHESESICSDVHGCQHCCLVPQRVDDVKRLENQNCHHGVGDVSDIMILLAGHAKVKEDPSDETRT